MIRNRCEHEEGNVCRCTAERVQQNAAVIESACLLADRKEVQIRHEGQIYRLRATRNGKLILNK